MTSNNHELIPLGATGPRVFPLAIGCMAMSGVYGATTEDEGIATIQHAIDHGINLIDTGDFYDMGHNEMLVGRALKGRRDRAILSVKFGAQRGPDGAFLGYDARPVAVKTACAYSLKRLGVEVIDVYRPARLDPSVPIEDTIGAIADLVKAGYVKHLGLSEVGPETLRRAAKVLPVVDLQIEYALVTRSPEQAIFPTLREIGASATLYGVFSRGLLTGSRPQGKTDFRAHLPRFSTDHETQNSAVVAAIQKFASELGITTAQLMLAWVRAKQPGFVPLLGAKTRRHIDDALGALDRALSADEVSKLEALVPSDAIAGTRYAAMQMKQLDSER